MPRKPPSEDRYLSKREQQIMELLHRHQRLTANQVTDLLPGQASNSTVRTLLRILEDKGRVRHADEGGRFVYTAVGSRQTWARAALRRVAETFYGGSIADVAVALVEDGGRMTDEEWARLQQAIDKTRSGRR